MRDARCARLRPQRGDPLYKNWPFLIVRDAASGVSYGVFYDNNAEGCFDLGCEHDNYFGRYRSYEAEDGDLDFYFILGPRLRDVTPKFVALTGGARRCRRAGRSVSLKPPWRWPTRLMHKPASKA